ncbi:MAG: hypothetical protein LUG56_05555 [Lachnospiraceae bacterium]|nr:hypothetical protein [Lachnospiraceae bacterium]
MKYNILTFLTAAIMVAVSTLALTSGMWIYEHNKLEAEEMRTPTTISNTMSTIYSDAAQSSEESDPTWERMEDIEEERDGGSDTGAAATQEDGTGD